MQLSGPSLLPINRISFIVTKSTSGKNFSKPMANRMCTILERQEDLRMDGLRNTIEAKGVHVLRPQPFQNMLISPDTFRFGTRLQSIYFTRDLKKRD